MGLTCHYFIICVLPLPEDAIYALSRSNNPTRVLRSQLKKNVILESSSISGTSCFWSLHYGCSRGPLRSSNEQRNGRAGRRTTDPRGTPEQKSTNPSTRGSGAFTPPCCQSPGSGPTHHSRRGQDFRLPPLRTPRSLPLWRAPSSHPASSAAAASSASRSRNVSSEGSYTSLKAPRPTCPYSGVGRLGAAILLSRVLRALPSECARVGPRMRFGLTLGWSLGRNLWVLCEVRQPAGLSRNF